MSDEFWKQFFTFAGIAIIQIIGLITLRATKTNTVITKENSTKLEEVHSLTNGRFTEAQEKIKQLEEENAKLHIDLSNRRSGDVNSQTSA